MNDRSGQKLGNYLLQRRLGQGGFAEVYLGEHVHLKTLAAIKVLHQVQLASDEEEKFQREARTIANLNHPHIIRVLDYGIQESTSTPFLVMDYAPKGTLRQRYATGRILSPVDILHCVKQVASALQFAHDRKLIHRDVKPENMLLDENNSIRLSDFGIAVVYDTTRALNTQDKFGTPPYMAPEQFQGKPVPASDQYALGIVVYEWLCGSRPFSGILGELIRQHEDVLPPSLREKVPSLSTGVERVIQQALAKDPGERFASVWDFALALEAACLVERDDNGTSRTKAMSSPAFAVAERARRMVATLPEDSSVIWNVPYRRNTFFTGREEVLAQLHEMLCSGKVASQTQAISGLGGIGKTQVAVEYANRYHHEYQMILWVRGDTREKMLSDIAALSFVLNLKEQYEQEQHRAVEAVRNWLRKNTHWLLIIDNIEDLTLMRTSLPSAVGGHILLTTRAQTTGNIAQRVDVEKMTLEEGALLLLRRTKMLVQDASLQEASPMECQRAKAVAEALDGLPLALDQAGAYIEETGCNLADYLRRYQAGRVKLLDRRGSFDTEHPASVTATFAHSFEKIEKSSPAAVELLRFCAFLYPEAIPEEIIVRGAAELGPILQPVASDPFALDAVIGMLRKFSLVRRKPETNMLSLHRLVQAVLQDRMCEETRQTWAERTVRAINLALPDINKYSMWQRCQQCMPHAQRCVDLIEEWKMVSPEAERLLEQTGVYLRIQAEYKQASVLFQRASDMRTLLGEAEQAEPVSSLINRFWYYYYQGEYAQAEPLIRKVVVGLQQTSEGNQQYFASCLAAFAHLSCEQGKYSRAEEYFLQALTIYEKQVGFQHFSVVCTFSGLGSLYLALAKYDRAEGFFWDALSIWQQMPEPQHPLKCMSINGLAQLSLAQGKYEQAELYLQQERTHLEQTVHAQHHMLAHSLNDWAILAMMQGKYNQVEPFLKQSLAIVEQTVGLEHPIAGRTFDTLGRFAYLQGKYKTAEQFLQRAQRIREQALGVEHPDVLTTINNLADVYTKQSRRSVAEELYKYVLAVRTRILGAEHPDVAQTYNSMAQLAYIHGEYPRTENLYKKALAVREKVLGPEHPDVAQSLYGLAVLYYWKWKQCERTEPLLRRALAIREKVLGSEHPEVAQVLKTYASLLLVLKRKAEAAEATMRAKTILAKHALVIDGDV